MKSLLTLLLMSLLTLTACEKPADKIVQMPNTSSTGTRGGGDTRVVAFLHFANQISTWLLLEKSDVTKADAQSFKDMTNRLAIEMDASGGPAIIFVDEELKDDSGAPKMALYSKDPLGIKVNRKAWESLNVEEKYVLVSLEIFGLIDLEGRYAVSDIISKNIHDISGIPNEANAPYMTKAGALFDTLYKLSEDDVQFRWSSVCFRQSTCHWFKNRGFHSGAELALLEMDRIRMYEKLTDGFIYLPLLFQMDVLATGVAQTATLEFTGGFNILERSGFSYPSESMGKHIAGYLHGLENLSKQFLKAGEGKLSPKVMNEIKSFQENVRKMIPQFEQYYQGDLNGKPITYVRQITPFSDYHQAYIQEIRREIVKQGCRVPSTFKFFMGRHLGSEELFADAVKAEAKNLEELRQQAISSGMAVRNSVKHLRQQWGSIIEKEDLNKLFGKNYGNLLDGDSDMAGNTLDLISILEDYVEAYLKLKEDSYPGGKEAYYMDKMMRGLKSGELCVK